MFRGKALAQGRHWLPGPCLAYLEARIQHVQTGILSLPHLVRSPGAGFGDYRHPPP